MNRRERVLRAVEMRKPDRCPIVHSVLPAAFLFHGQPLLDLLRQYPNDFGSSEHSIPEIEALSPTYRAGRHSDEWGTTWISSTNGIHGQVGEHPIRSWEDAEQYEFPPLPTAEEVEKTKRDVSEAKADRYVMHGFKPGNYFERLHFLLGFRTVLKSLTTRERAFKDFADRFLDYCLESIQMTLDVRPDCVSFGDDWGAQDRLLVHPEVWRSFFKPRYKKMFDLVHDHGCLVALHSDGYILAIIDDLHEIGVNILNPQFSCHPLDELADKTRGRFCINSDIDRQALLPRGTPASINAHIKRVVEIFGTKNNGGLLGRGELNMDVPLENIKAMFDAWLQHGKYQW